MVDIVGVRWRGLGAWGLQWGFLGAWVGDEEFGGIGEILYIFFFERVVRVSIMQIHPHHWI